MTLMCCKRGSCGRRDSLRSPPAFPDARRCLRWRRADRHNPRPTVKRRHEHMQASVARLRRTAPSARSRARIRPLWVCDRASDWLGAIAGAARSVGANLRRNGQRRAIRPSDPPEMLRALPMPPPTAGSAAEAAGRRANRRASGTDAGRAASTGRSAIPDRSDRGRAATGSTKPVGVSSPRSKTRRRRSRSPASSSRLSTGSTLTGSWRSFCR